MRYLITPVPKKVEGIETTCAYPTGIRCAEPGWKGAAALFARDLQTITGMGPGEGEGIVLECAPSLAPGAYCLDIGDCARLTASDVAGVNHGLATLLQLARAREGMLELPAVRVEDAPDKPYRGLMLDLARHWHPFEELLDAVDLCWLHKVSPLHLHFVDDESYTLPCGPFPLLPTEGRHYTAEQIAELVEYARARGVELLPEVEMPGHSTQFQEKYPEVFGESGVMCCEEKTFSALRAILAEVAELFPYAEYIHVGGDEADINKWYDCPGCVAFMREQGISDIHELYAEFVARTTQMVFDLGRKPIVWEGFPAAFNARVRKDVVVFAWESYYQTAPELLEGGFNIINASWKPLYIVSPDIHWSPAEIERWNVYKWQHWWVKSQAYHNDIIVTPTERVLGGQICVWGDLMFKYEDPERAAREEFALLRPRLAMFAERAWNIDPACKDVYAARLHAEDIMKKLQRV